MEVAQQFKAPKNSLGDLNAEAAAGLIAAAADVALILDGAGIVRDLAFGNHDTVLEDCGAWLGQPWIESVTIESRPKVEAMLREVAQGAPAKPRQVNHPASKGGPDVPILYSVVPLGNDGRVVALGRDLRKMAALQQRLLDAQHSIEREYQRLRQAETRYRLLFQMAGEAVLIVDSSNNRIIEANPAAGLLLGSHARTLIGKTFPDGLEQDSTQAVRGLLSAVKSAGQADDVVVRAANQAGEYAVSASLFRQDNESYFLVRLSQLSGDDLTTSVRRSKTKLIDVVENLPDGFVVTNVDGSVLTANRAFLEFVQLAREEQVRGQPLERWFGRAGVEFNVVMNNLRQNGSVRLFPTILRGDLGSTIDVEVSGVSVLNGEHPCFGFTFRNAASASPDTRSRSQLPRSVEQLTELVGRVPLRDLVQETTDVIEKLCIEAALEITGDNRASAAEMLGLSRQSLYVKLRRYGLGDLAADN